MKYTLTAYSVRSDGVTDSEVTLTGATQDDVSLAIGVQLVEMSPSEMLVAYRLLKQALDFGEYI
jgi:hypothetical protein